MATKGEKWGTFARFVFVRHRDVSPVDHRGSSPCHHGPDPASGIEQRQFEAGAALGVEVGDVGLLRKGQRGKIANQSGTPGGTRTDCGEPLYKHAGVGCASALCSATVSATAGGGK